MLELKLTSMKKGRERRGGREGRRGGRGGRGEARRGEAGASKRKVSGSVVADGV